MSVTKSTENGDETSYVFFFFKSKSKESKENI